MLNLDLSNLKKIVEDNDIETAEYIVINKPKPIKIKLWRFAIALNNIKIFKLFIKHNFDINTHKQNALRDALENESNDIVKAFIENEKYDLNVKDIEYFLYYKNESLIFYLFSQEELKDKLKKPSNFEEIMNKYKIKENLKGF